MGCAPAGQDVGEGRAYGVPRSVGLAGQQAGRLSGLVIDRLVLPGAAASGNSATIRVHENFMYAHIGLCSLSASCNA